MGRFCKAFLALCVREFYIVSTIHRTLQQMDELASKLPEYQVIMSMYGVGDTLGQQLMAEIGDIRRFKRKQSLSAFAGVYALPFQSGQFEATKNHISKRGSPHLRKTLFQVMSVYIRNSPLDEPVYRFLDKKRSEGKNHYLYMTASANKFLRIYYGTLKRYLAEHEYAV